MPVVVIPLKIFCVIVHPYLTPNRSNIFVVHAAFTSYVVIFSIHKSENSRVKCFLVCLSYKENVGAAKKTE